MASSPLIRFRIERTPRGWPLRSFLRSGVFWALAAYFGFLFGISLLSLYSDVQIDTCMFRRVVGRPCLTCGATRIVFGVFEGQLWSGFLLNPLVFVLLVVGTNLLLLKLLWGRRIELTLAPRLRVGLLTLAALLAIANWVWVWNTHPPS